MSHEFKFVARGVGSISALILPMCTLLSACGGGGGGGNSFVASIPPPPATPTPPPTSATPLTTVQGYSLKGSLDVQTSWLSSPATRAGNYDLIGRLTLTHGNGDPTSYRAVSPDEFTLALTNPNGQAFNYALSAPSGILPGGLTSVGPASAVSSWDISQNVAYRYDNPYEDWPQALGQRLTAFDKAADGSETQLFSYDFARGSTGTITSLGSGNSLRTTLNYDIGYSYVAMGEWSWRAVDLNGAAAGDFGNLLFVNGDRTPVSGIPVSGTATYDAHSFALLSRSFTAGIPFSLTADFGQGAISTRIDQDYRYNPAAPFDGDAALGIHVGGSAPFSNGLFAIPLTGTANYSYNNVQITPPAETVTGTMNGAFFGPHAEQVGGVFSVERPNGVLLMQDAFVGRQH
jgi:hypothetical protein